MKALFCQKKKKKKMTWEEYKKKISPKYDTDNELQYESSENEPKPPSADQFHVSPTVLMLL